MSWTWKKSHRASLKPASRGGRAWRCGNEDCSWSGEGALWDQKASRFRESPSEMVCFIMFYLFFLFFLSKVDVDYEEKNLWPSRLVWHDKPWTLHPQWMVIGPGDSSASIRRRPATRTLHGRSSLSLTPWVGLWPSVALCVCLRVSQVDSASVLIFSWSELQIEQVRFN